MGDFEEALDAVRRRLDRARDADDPALMLDPAAVAEADRLEALLSGDGADAIPAMIALGWVYSYRYSALSDDAGRRKYFDRAIESFTTCFCLLAVFRDGDIPEIPAALMPQVAIRAAEAGGRWLDAARSDPDPARPVMSVRLWQRIVAVTDAGHPGRAIFLSQLGAALLLRSERTGDRADLDAAIQSARDALAILPADDQDRAGYLNKLGAALLRRADLAKALADLDEGIQFIWDALTAAPEGHPDHAACLGTVASAFQVRFEHRGVRADLDAAIQFGRWAVDAFPDGDPARAVCLASLQLSLTARFRETGKLEDLDDVIEAVRSGLASPTASLIVACCLVTWAWCCSTGTSSPERWRTWMAPSPRTATRWPP